MGIDYVPAAIEAAKAKSRGAARLSYVVGDVTRLPPAQLGTFDFFLDIGCFQGLDTGQRLSEGSGVSALANPAATLLLLSFGPSRWRWLVEGASQEEVQTAFAGWEMLASKPADTAGPGLLTWSEIWCDVETRRASDQAATVAFSQVTDSRMHRLHIITSHLFSLLRA